MSENETVANTTNTIIGIIMIAILFVVMLLALVLIVDTFTAVPGITEGTSIVSSEAAYANSSGYTLAATTIGGFNSPVLTALSNRTDTKATTNELNGWINATGYTLSKSTLTGFSSPVITTIINATSGSLIGSANYTLVGNSLRNATATVWQNVTLNYTWSNVIAVGNATVSAAGVVTNASATVWNNLSISYTYDFDNSTAQDSYVGLDSIKTSTVGLVVNFFALAPTIGTILGVIILIAGIVVLVLYVKRMRDDNGSSSEGYYG